MQTLAELMEVLPQTGRVDWIGVRPQKNVPMETLTDVEAIAGKGLAGDRFRASRTKREVTLISGEHVDAVSSMVGRDVDPAELRRNILVRGINLLALKGKQFVVGGAVLEYTGLAHPCSKMEAALGPGGYNAMRGHGGITARIVESGTISRGAAVHVR